MHPGIRILIGMLLPATLAGCGGPDYQPPDVKTHPDPKQRYAITVTLVDPPPGISSITGITDFRPHTACIPTNDPINHTDAVAVFYRREFSLSRIADNTYRGHIYLDWPVDEDYYGLGVCEWELRRTDIQIGLLDYVQNTYIWSETGVPDNRDDWWCRRPSGEYSSKGCLSPDEFEAIKKEQSRSYNVILTAEKDFQ